MLSPHVLLQKFLGSKWPQPLGEEWKDLSLTLQKKTHDVALKILQGLAIALGRGEKYFDEVRHVRVPLLYDLTVLPSISVVLNVLHI